MPERPKSSLRGDRAQLGPVPADSFLAAALTERWGPGKRGNELVAEKLHDKNPNPIPHLNVAAVVEVLGLVGATPMTHGAGTAEKLTWNWGSPHGAGTAGQLSSPTT